MDRSKSGMLFPRGPRGRTCLFVICVKTIEEMFGDFKKHGLDLERTHLRHFLRLSRLTLAACLLYLWLIALGEHVLVHGLASQVDRTDRRDLSIFRLGWDFLEDSLRLFVPLPTVSLPNFCSVSGR